LKVESLYALFEVTDFFFYQENQNKVQWNKNAEKLFKSIQAAENYNKHIVWIAPNHLQQTSYSCISAIFQGREVGKVSLQRRLFIELESAIALKTAET
jgi:hypothetical protein